MTNVRQVWWRAAAQDGFTLAEMLVVLAILGIVLAGLTVLLGAGMKTQTDQTNRVGAQQDVRVALDKLRREIHCGSALTYNSSSSVTVTLPPYCATAPSAATPSPVTWCVSTAAPYTLRRYVGDVATAGMACANPGGVTSTVMLVSSSVFGSYTRPSPLQRFGAPTFAQSTSGGTIRPGTYTYDVTAVTANGEFSGTPAQVTVAGGAGSTTSNALTLSWSPYTDPSGAAATSYRVYGRDDGSTTAEGLRLLATVAGTSYTDTGPAITTLSSTVTLPAGTIPVGDTSKFTWPQNTIAFASSGTVTCSGTTGTAFTGCSGGAAGTYPSGTPVIQARTAASPVDPSPPLATLNVSLVADKTPADASQRFTLSDAISLRNSGRY